MTEAEVVWWKENVQARHNTILCQTPVFAVLNSGPALSQDLEMGFHERIDEV
jgi:hypothetical protein